MSTGDHNEMVEALVADGAHESLRERVRTRRADRGANRLDTDRGEDRVKVGGEFGVPIAYEEPESSTGLFEVGGEVACDLGHPRAVRVSGDAEDVDYASFQFDHEQHVAAAEQHGVDVEEVSGNDTLGLDRKSTRLNSSH